MRENTDHPTQKPEKLVAKLILASTRPEETVFDPFLGSGTSAAAATKLNRRFLGIEIDEDFCCLAAKRVELAKKNSAIQGYSEAILGEKFTRRPSSAKRSEDQKRDPGVQGNGFRF
jgi:site-specific DNA-methyltransferase (adenine-specific)